MKIMFKMVALMLEELERVISLTSDVIIKTKAKYVHSLGNKLNNPQTDEISLVYTKQVSSEEKHSSSFHQFYQMGFLLQMYVRK